jgi:hypothetical protein
MVGDGIILISLSHFQKKIYVQHPDSDLNKSTKHLTQLRMKYSVLVTEGRNGKGMGMEP